MSWSRRFVEYRREMENLSPPENNFVERVRFWALAQPERLAFRFLEGGEIENAAELSFAMLDQRARAIAAALVARGLAGERALMLYPPGLDFVIAFCACHYAGIVPVPAFPPRRNRNMGRISSISEDVKAAVALTMRSVIDQQEIRKKNSGPTKPGRLEQIPWIPTEEVPSELAGDWVSPRINEDDLALIQYTSGSTGSPKGVMLTHRNLIWNCKMICEKFGLTNSSEGVTWLPVYHDMGLIGGVLSPVFKGFTTSLLSPITFLTRPIRWLQAVSHYRADTTGGPNFAYALCNLKVSPEQCEGLDFSNWEVAFNGAEPVRADVLEEFTRKFAPFGFRAKCHYPCYGMAEATLIVTGGDKDQEPVIKTFDKSALAEHRVVPVAAGDDNAKALVGCGQRLPDEEVIIVNPETRRRLQDDQIGEIWINSPSCGQGYWDKDDISSEVFHARLSPDNGKRYLRSGDLGFLDDGELYVSGRLKDMIIIRGVNRYPQDIEATIEQCDPRTRSGGSAAFAVERWDREHLVVVAEVQRRPDHKSWDDLIEIIRSAVTEEHDIAPDAIVLVRAHSIPKTSSGKVQRHACRQSFKHGELLTIAGWISWEDSNAEATDTVPASAPSKNGQQTEPGYTSEQLDAHGLSAAVVDAVIFFVRDAGREQAKHLTLETNIVGLGLDSLTRAEIAANLQETFGGRLPEEVLQETQTIREVAMAIQQHIGSEPVNADYRLRRDLPSDKRKNEIPESYYQLEKMPEFVRLQRMKQEIASTGLRNPFFSVHEGKIKDTTRIGRTRADIVCQLQLPGTVGNYRSFGIRQASDRRIWH